jgi:ABC-type transport system substrate-binding protein
VSSRSVKIIIITLGAIAISAYMTKRLLPRKSITEIILDSKPEAHLRMSAWTSPDGTATNSPSLRWIIRQCRSPFLHVTPMGVQKLITAESIHQAAPGKWVIELRKDLRWNDGTPFTAKDISASWELRRDYRSKLDLDAVESVNDVSSTSINVTFKDGSVSPEKQLKILTSPWLTAIRTQAPYSLDQELITPCAGPFNISKSNSSRVMLTRHEPQKLESIDGNGTSKEPKQTSTPKNLIHRIEIQALDPKEPLTFKEARDLMLQGQLSFARGLQVTARDRSDNLALFRTSTTGDAYYLWIDPKGAFAQQKLIKFLHRAINRGELMSVSHHGEMIRAMHRLIPFSVHDKNDTPIVSMLAALNFESVDEASHLMGIPTAKPEASSGFKASLQTVPHTLMVPVAQILAGRLRANYMIDLEVQSQQQKDKSADLVIFSLPASGNAATWANSLANSLEIFPHKPQKYPEVRAILGKITTATLAGDEATAINNIEKLDQAILGQWNLVPLGQSGFDYLVDPTMTNIRLTDDPEVDPDFSQATKTQTQGT